MRRSLPLLLLAALPLAGCGSTVQGQGATTAFDRQQLGTGGLQAPPGSAAGTVGTGAGGTAAQPLTAAGGTAGTGAVAPRGAAATAAPTSGPAAAGGGDGNGAAPVLASGSHTPIKVGFEIIVGGNQLVTQGLGTPVNFGDGKTEVRALVDYLNKHGGINGHPIQPFYGQYNAASGDSGRESDCTAMTEDDHVSFIITVVNISQNYVACAAAHHVPVINASFGAGDDGLYAQFPDYLYSASLLDLNREERLVLTTEHDAGRISPARRVGVIVDNTPPGDPQYQRVLSTTVVPMLKAWQVPYETFAVTTQGDVSNAVLKFRADGVKTVVFVAPSGIIEILFMQAAEQQGYRPDYGLGDSTDSWFIGQAAPSAQVQHITGAGSLPISNVPVSQYPTTAREKKCLDVISAGGEHNADRHASLTATVYCEALDEFVAVASKVTGALTPAAYHAAFPTVGTTFDPVTTFAANFGTGRHDNAALYRLIGYSARCQCISYQSGLRPVPA